MALCFISKQVEHLKSTLVLIKNHQHSDATAIARIMLEGMALLRWAAQHPKRAYNWRIYAWVSDYKLLQKKKTQGEEIPESLESTLRQKLGEIGKQFLTPEAQKAIHKDREMPQDPYRGKWLLREDGKKLYTEDIFHEIDEPLLFQLYCELNDWIHWSPRGIGESLQRKEEAKKVSFVANPLADAATALAAGFKVLHNSLELLGTHMELDYQETLNDIAQNYLDDLHFS